MESLEVEAVGRVTAVDGVPGFVVVDGDGVELPAATQWLLQLAVNDCSLHTVRAYAMSLLRFLRFLWAVEVSWQRATLVETRDFVLWARQASKFVGNKRPPGARGRINVVTGKHYLGEGYSPKTINHTLSAVHEFYAFHLEAGVGPLINPVPSSGRPYAGHNPEDDFVRRRRASLRQKEPVRLPRSIPDAQFGDLFKRLGSHRDRALVAFYVSSGARAGELLGLTGEMVNYGDALIGVFRKGGALAWIPASPDAFVWLRLYELERGTPGRGEAVWLTLREPRRPLTYPALRAVLRRANDVLGANWSIHDLRHTFAVRALEGGMALHEVQELLGHASLDTTSIYTRPRIEEVIAHHRVAVGRRALGREPLGNQASDEVRDGVGAGAVASEGYDPEEMSVLFDRGSDDTLSERRGEPGRQPGAEPVVE